MLLGWAQHPHWDLTKEHPDWYQQRLGDVKCGVRGELEARNWPEKAQYYDSMLLLETANISLQRFCQDILIELSLSMFGLKRRKRTLLSSKHFGGCWRELISFDGAFRASPGYC